MNKKTLLLIGALLAVVLMGASVLYSSLGDRVGTTGLAPIPTTEPAVEATETIPETEAMDYSAPDFTVQDWDGNEVQLSDFEGKPVVLNFWASWCGPCKIEMPDFEEAYQKYGEKIHFLMVNCTGNDSMQDAKALIEESGYTFPIFFDTTSEAAYTYGASSIPMTIFIDANGDLVTYGVGALSAELLQTGIDMIYTPEETQ